MKLQLKGNPQIEALNGHSPSSVEILRQLLVQGAPATPDSHRSNFYEVENCTRVFYIHICPSGKVQLLAIWDQPMPLNAAGAAEFRCPAHA
jgi:hypothetical protein